MIKSLFRDCIPGGVVGNLEWRSQVFKYVMEDESSVEKFRLACAKDPIFFCNGFVWTYDPRPEYTLIPKTPFVLYKFQEIALLEIINAIGRHDLLIEKSRDMGASWMSVLAMTWYWLFRPLQSFLFVSRVEDYVDKPGNPKALFWKFDFLVNNLPTWLRPLGYNKADHRRKLHAKNPENGSVIDGESTTGQVARGDRRTAILLDEFAAVEQGTSVLSATRDATTCRIFNSTPEGINNAFYDMRQSGIKKLRLHWTSHPIKAHGLYCSTPAGKLRVIHDAGYPVSYQPTLDGKLRSPWYDEEYKRAATPQEIAQELDIDYLGSGHQYFDASRIQEAIRRYARSPNIIGDLIYDETTGDPIEFRENPAGALRLWCLLDGDGAPQYEGKLSIGIDVAAGTGASNSCLAGYDNETREKILEYVNPYIRPEAFAKLTIAVARWFKNKTNKAPFLVWESNGPGRQFGSRVLELRYGTIYLRRNDKSIKKKVSDIPGVAPTKETKLMLIGGYRSAVESFRVVNRSKEALEETLEYVHTPNQGVAHARSMNRLDPSGAKDNHGDRAMADALAFKGLNEQQIAPKPEEPPEIPVGSLAWRRRLRKEAEEAAGPRRW